MKENRSIEPINRDNKNKDTSKHYDHDYGLNKKPIKRPTSPINPFPLLSSPLRDSINVISSNSSSDDDQDSEWIFNCICNNRDVSDPMICCDGCNAWMHISCLKLKPNHLPKHFYCSSCFSHPSFTKNKITSNDTNVHNSISTNNSSMNNGVGASAAGVGGDDDTVSTMSFHKQAQSPIHSNFQKPISSINISPEKAESLGVSDRNDIDTDSEQQCDCIQRISDVLKKYPSFDYSHIFQTRSNKNSHSFTLKNGQKILKSSRTIVQQGFVIEMRGDIHILDECPVLAQNYNTISSFLYNVEVSPKLTLVVDVRNSNHFGRYARRSCIPNCKIGFAMLPDSVRFIRPLIYSSELIEKHQELTVPIDRTSDIFQTHPNHSNKHHWQKYDYSSALICQCRHPKRVSDSSTHPLHNNGMPLICPILGLKEIVLSIKGPGRKISSADYKTSPRAGAGAEEDDDVYSGEDSSSSGADNPAPELGLSREEKKMSSIIKLINKMEEEHSKPTKIPSKRGRKPGKVKKSSSIEETSSVKESKLFTQPQLRTQSQLPLQKEQISVDVGLSKKTNGSENVSSPLPAEEVKEKSWYVPPQISRCVLENASSVTSLIESQPVNTHHRRGQIPIKLAIRRGLYHLAFNEPHQGLLYNSRCRSQIFLDNLRRLQQPVEHLVNVESKDSIIPPSSTKCIASNVVVVEPAAKISNISNIDVKIEMDRNNLPPIPELRSTLAVSSFSKSPPNNVKNVFSDRDYSSK